MNFIDNFNVTATQDSFLSVVLKYRCQILFTTRSNLNEYCTFQLKEIKDINILFQLTSAFYSEADKYRSTVEKIIETVHYHTFAVELAAKLLENGISTPGQLLAKLQEERASLDNEDKIKIIKDGQSSKATYYSHIHTLFSLYALSRKQQDIMCNLCFLPYTGISARIFAKWLELPTLNEINDLIETGFVQTTTRHTISLHPMIKEIALSETKPSVSSCHILLDSLQKICLMHGIEVDYYKKLFQTAGNIIELIEKDDIPKYLLFLENVFPYMDNYNYQKGMKEIIQEYPQLRIAIGHFGMVTTPHWQEQIKLARHKNVMIESGGITWLFNSEFYPFHRAVKAIKEAADLVGMDKLMWGSDYPRTITAITYKMSYDFILKTTEMTQEEKALFLGKNAERFYGFKNLISLPYIKNMSE